MGKKKILKIIGIILLVILVFVMIHTIRNTIIINNLQKRVEKYSNSNNYHIKSISNVSENTTMIMNQYQKDDKQLLIIDRTVDNENVKMSFYKKDTKVDTFIETKDEKIARLNVENSILGISSIDIIQTDNLWQTIIYGLTTKIKTINVNGCECYSIDILLTPDYLIGKSKTEYDIEKETGLPKKLILDEQKVTREYEFGNVDDSIFVEPDISQYTLEDKE